MDIKVGGLNLATSSIADMTNFLTHVLDLEVVVIDGVPQVQIGILKVNFIESELTDLSHSTFLTLEIPDQDFESIVEKYTFFMFRKNLDARNFYEVLHDGILLKDLDGRIWKMKTLLDDRLNLSM